MKPNIVWKTGILLISMTLMLKHLVVGLPDFVYGLCFGTGLGLEIIGLYASKHDISRFRNYKINLLKKILQ